MNDATAARRLRLVAFGSLLAFAVLSFASPASAFDGARRGFVIGLGIGTGLTSLQPSRDGATGTRREDTRLGFDFLVGYAPREKFVLQLGVRGGGARFEGDDATLLTVGLGARLYPFAAAPSVYLNALYGTASLERDTAEQRRADDADEDFSPAGSALLAGIGLELRPHLYLEASHVRATLVDPRDRFVTIDTAQTQLSLGWVWY